MNLFYAKNPENKELFQIQELIQVCGQYEPVTFSFQGQDNTYVLLFDGQTLICAISLFFPEPNVCECIGFTRPGYRRQGYFSQCLEKVCDILEQRETEDDSQIDLLLLTDGNSPDARETLTILEAEYLYSEYAMEISSKSLAGQNNSNVAFNETLPGQFSIVQSGVVCGSFSLYQTETYSCLYELFIEPAFRRKKIAENTLCLLGKYLKKNGIPCLKLQVSENNTAALCLYRKTGFHVTETLSYYLY